MPSGEVFILLFVFSKSTFLKKNLSGIRSECQTVWIQIRLDVSRREAVLGVTKPFIDDYYCNKGMSCNVLCERESYYKIKHLLCNYNICLKFIHFLTKNIPT